MARHLPKTLTKLSSSLNLSINPSKSLLLSLSSRFLSLRYFHTQAHLTDTNSSSSSVAGAGLSAGEIEVMGIRSIEDAIHSIIVRHAAPDWLPFLPGSSYWVPPKRRADNNFVELVGQLVNPLIQEESLSLINSSRGWPCSSVFFEGSEHSIPVEVEVQVLVQASPERTSSEDED